MRVLIIGANGQLARQLVATVPSGVELSSVSRSQCDITDITAVDKVFRSIEPDLIINTAAYTAVDAAEENQETAFGVNASGAGNVARATCIVGSRLIHISTDYVFDGVRSTPYPPEAPTNPLNVYGASKLKGEDLVRNAAPSSTIIRVGWLYSTTGKNFLVSILAGLLASRPLSVVEDQRGCPTSAYEFAKAIWKMRGVSPAGIYHWANLGSATWYDFASEIALMAQRLGLLQEKPIVKPTRTDTNRYRATRPGYSVLDPTKLAEALQTWPSPWEEALRRDMTRELYKLPAAG